MKHICISTANEKPKDPFHPTRFVYAYFMLNSLTNVKWKDSYASENGNIIYYERATTYSRTSECSKIYYLIDFIAKHTSSTEKDSFCDCIIDRLASHTADKIAYVENKLNTLNNHIIPASTDGFYECTEWEEIKNCFINGLRDLSRKQNFKNALKGTLKFIYKVRCNIFHGVKDLTHIGKEHEKRIALYADILEVVNEFALKAIEKADQEFHNSSFK